LCDRFDARPHLVEGWLLRSLATRTCAAGDRQAGFVGHGEFGRAQTLDFVAPPRRFLEIQVNVGDMGALVV
jgi:hypothetical protein